MRSADDDLVSAPTIDPVIPAEQPRRTGVARWIRRLAIPIIVGWIALIAVLNVAVPQLEVVGQMRSVSMSPKEAPSVVAMMRVGKVFEEFDSDSSAMIVLEGDQPPRRRTPTGSTTTWSTSSGPTPSTSSTSRTSGATR